MHDGYGGAKAEDVGHKPSVEICLHALGMVAVGREREIHHTCSLMQCVHGACGSATWHQNGTAAL